MLAEIKRLPDHYARVPMVQSPVKTMGAMVMATSRTRRSASRRSPQIATNDSTPAWMNATTTA